MPIVANWHEHWILRQTIGMNVAGFDCGGTSSRLQVCDPTGKVIFESKSGAANWASTPREVLHTHLRTLCSDAPKISTAAVCMAGLLTDQDKSDLKGLVSELLPDAEVIPYPDYAASLSACDDPDAICVISGTGSLISSFGVNGIVKSGGGGPLLGDVGSGFWAGKVLLTEWLIPSQRERISPAALECVRKVLGANDEPGVVAAVYRNRTPGGQLLANLGGELARAADAGDEYCQGILGSAMQPLADLVHDHMRHQGFPERKFKVYRTGGFWDASPMVIRFFESWLRMQTYAPKLTPLEGAVRLATQ